MLASISSWEYTSFLIHSRFFIVIFVYLHVVSSSYVELTKRDLWRKQILNRDSLLTVSLLSSESVAISTQLLSG